MKIRISGHLDKNVLFEKNQHDFCEKKKIKSCLKNKFFEGVNKYVDRGDQDYPVYLDFQKTFD